MDFLRLLSVNVSEPMDDFRYKFFSDETWKAPHYSELLNTVMVENWFLSFIAVAIYLPTIFGIKAYMAKRKAFDLRAELFLWNSALGIFSAFALAQMVPDVLQTIWHHGFQSSICDISIYNIATIPYICLMFVYSKFVELGDTVFIVLRKKPLVFLQWYHHCITLIYSWSVGPLYEPINVLFTMINLGIHSMMYPYFAVKSLGYNPPRWVASSITTCQLVQMIAVFAINIYSLRLIRSGILCRRFAMSIYMNFFIFTTFIFMFGKLFVDVVKKSVGTKKKFRAE